MSTIRKNVVVVIADIVNSTHFSSEQTALRLKMLMEKLETKNVWLLSPEVFRGDSFQGVLKDVEAALFVAVFSRALLKAEDIAWDLRMAIGVGEVNRLADRPGTSDGEAFRLSGQLADTMKKDRARIAVALPIPSDALQSVLLLLEVIIEKWTARQAAVIVRLMNGDTKKEISEALKMSQSAVSQHAQAAKWWAVEPILHTFGSLIKARYPHD